MSDTKQLYEVAQTMLLEMNKKLQSICILSDNDCYLIHKPSSLRMKLQDRIRMYEFTQGPTTNQQGKIILLAADKDGNPVTLEKFTEQVNKIQKGIDEDDAVIVDTVTEYDNAFVELAKKYNSTSKEIYDTLNKMGKERVI
jgi:NACalpha-BTF3-like transcription factor